MYFDLFFFKRLENDCGVLSGEMGDGLREIAVANERANVAGNESVRLTEELRHMKV